MIRPLLLSVTTLAGQASSQTTLPSHYLYEFDIRVVSNQFIPLGQGGDLLQLTVGSIGRLDLLVNTDPDLLPDGNKPGVTNAYVIEELAFNVNGVTAGGASGVYPSTNFFTGLLVQNDGLGVGGRLLDQLTSIFAFDNPSFGLSIMTLSDSEPAGTLPALLSSTDLPTSLDLSLLDAVDMSIGSPTGGAERVNFEFFGVTITPVPNSATGVLFAISGFLASKRRRQGTSAYTKHH